MDNSLINKLWGTKFELVKVLLLHEYKEFITQEMLNNGFNEARSWILLYEITVVTGDKERFYAKLNIKNSKAFYDKLLEENYTFYLCRKKE